MVVSPSSSPVPGVSRPPAGSSASPGAAPSAAPSPSGVPGEGFVRVRLPREGEILGVVVGNVGGGRLQVQCKDGKERLCRIPGKIRRNIWVRQGDIVLVEPWKIEGEKRGDVIWRYNHLQADWLRNKGYISR
ncbi:Translation initiation factor 1A [uncultured archaeon]|nr:Translation initiation factor 1A [uncultured archaeon]